MISQDLLIRYRAKEITLSKNEVLFNEGGCSGYYFQIIGEIKMFNLTEIGKEFVQGIFGDGKSFGEPPLLGDFKYPAGASSTKPSSLLKLPKKAFLSLLKANPEVHLAFTGLLCKRLAYKAMIGNEVSIHPPEHRILTLLEYIKVQNNSKALMITLTRQQIAELTGLLVETVIRSIKKLEAEKILRLENHKIIM